MEISKEALTKAFDFLQNDLEILIESAPIPEWGHINYDPLDPSKEDLKDQAYQIIKRHREKLLGSHENVNKKPENVPAT